MVMDSIYSLNGEERMPTKEEIQILLDRMMEKLGYERVHTENSEKEKT